MATYLLRCVEVGREIQDRQGKLRRDLASVIGERFPDATIVQAPGRLVVTVDADVGDELATLPGVTSVSPCVRVAQPALEAAVLALARDRLTPAATAPATPPSFAIRVRRGGGRDGTLAHERTPDIARRLGDAVSAATGARVDLACPDVAIGVELRGDDAFVFDHVIAGVDRAGPTAHRCAGEPRFVADQMLGRLAARLRLLGYDTLTVYDLADSEVTRLAAAGGRILLTRDSGLARTRAVPVHRVLATTPREQLAEILDALALTPDPARYFTRCTLCNTPVEPVAEADAGDRVPPSLRGRDLAFAHCPACDQLYWRGSHVARILADLLAAGAPEPAGLG